MTAPVPERWVDMAERELSSRVAQLVRGAGSSEDVAAAIVAPVLADLREQVQALRDRDQPYLDGWGRGWEAMADDVLALLGGGQS